MRRIDGDRREHGEDEVEEVILEPVALLLGQLVGVEDMNAGLAEQRLERDPVLLLVRREVGHELVDAVELLGGRQPILARRLDAGDDLGAQARHAHHVELVEIGGGDRQEAQAFEQRMALVLRLFHHPLIEVEPGQLAIEIAARPEGGDAGGRAIRLDRFLQIHR